MRHHGESAVSQSAFPIASHLANSLSGTRNSAFSENFRAGGDVAFRPNLDSQIESHVTMV
jgi:hypothetical protein